MDSVHLETKKLSIAKLRVKKVLTKPQFWFGLAVMVPWLVWYIVFLYRPILLGLRISVMKYNAINPDLSRFIGLDNFRNILTYSRFWVALRNTVTYSLLQYALSMPLALIVAWSLIRVKRRQRFYEFVVFLPYVVSMVAISLLFKMLMDPQFGTLNRILRAVGLPTSRWVSGSRTAMISVVIVAVWKGLGFPVVLLSTAMRAVPKSLYDAAEVDGATGFQLFRYVTLPLIANSIVMVSVMTVIGGLQVYVLPSVLGPGPGKSTLVMNQLIIDEAFSNWRFGFGAGMAFLMLILILVLTVFQMRVLRRRWDY